MPDRDVKTIKDQIFFQYAKIIARSAFGCANGKEAKSKHYGFIKKTFRELQSGKKSWSDIVREDKQFVQSDKKCIYCDGLENLQWEHLVPKSININSRCKTCERILGIHNQIWACSRCNGAGGKWNKGLYTFFKSRLSREKKFFDVIPPLAEKKYLKTIYYCHQCAGTLENGDIDGDGLITVLDLDYIISQSLK
ncbi:MAG TPA: HNH endonuclease [Elusimicrobiales bacterium]|nr:HNH endonuclease [Elusimicrobiales bacterium]